MLHRNLNLGLILLFCMTTFATFARSQGERPNLDSEVHVSWQTKSNIDSGRVNLPDGGCLYYETHGSPKRDALVLIHGGNMDHRVWNPQIGKFSEKYRVITYDVRGFGKSSEKDKPHQAHRDLCCLLDELKIHQPVHVAGLSLGGKIAVDFTLCNPDRVRSLTLVAPGLSGWDWYDADWQPVLGAMRNNPDRNFARKAVVETWLASPGMISAMRQKDLQDVIRKWTTENVRSELSDLIRLSTDADEPLSPPATKRLHEIAVPTLLLVVTNDSLDILDIANRIENGIRGTKRVTFKGVGHIITLEAPEKLTRKVLKFLRSTEK